MYLWRGVRLLRAFTRVTPSLAVKKQTVTIHPSTTISQLAERMGVSPLSALKSFKDIEEDSSLHFESPVSVETAQLLAFEFNCIPVVAVEKSQLPLRPPVVTIMGHVDHGKTTLLDAFRKSNICSGEYGGITQGIGAFSMVASNGQHITFIDTPGHQAFSKMRARGTQVTDMVILVVCAVEGVQPQTREALGLAKEAGVPIIVALNKIDLPGANIGKIELQLLDAGLDLDKFGGETLLIPISAKKKTNLDRLEEALLFKAELMDLRDDPDCMAQGSIIESRATGNRGNTCSALIRRGTLKSGDILVAGKAFGRIKKMTNDAGQTVTAAGPSTAVEVTGLEELPEAGESFFVVSLLRKARFMSSRLGEEKEALKTSDPNIANTQISLPRLDRIQRSRFRAGHTDIMVEKMKEGDTEDTLFSRKAVTPKKPKKNEQARQKKNLEGRTVQRANSMTADQTHSIVTNTAKSQVSLVLKACNKGMLEALISSVYQVAGQAGATVEIVKSDVGAVTVEDLRDAEEFEAVILGMDVPVPNSILNQAKAKQIPLKAHKIIYHLLDDVAALAKDLVAPSSYMHLMGSAQIKQVFPPSKASAPTVAGLEVRVGAISQSLRYKIIREGTVVAENLTASSLRRHKQDVREVSKGMECGLILDNFSDYKEGDIVEGYEEKRTEKQFKVEQVVVEAADVKDK